MLTSVGCQDISEPRLGHAEHLTSLSIRLQQTCSMLHQGPEPSLAQTHDPMPWILSKITSQKSARLSWSDFEIACLQRVVYPDAKAARGSISYCMSCLGSLTGLQQRAGLPLWQIHADTDVRHAWTMPTRSQLLQLSSMVHYDHQSVNWAGSTISDVTSRGL